MRPHHVVILALCVPAAVHGQPNPVVPHSFDLRLGAAAASFSGDTRNFGSLLLPPKSSSLSAMEHSPVYHIRGGVNWNLPASLSFGVDFSFAGTRRRLEAIEPIVVNVGGAPVETAILTTVDASETSVFALPRVSWQPNVPLRLSVGLLLPLTRSLSWTAGRRILNPDVEFVGEIPLDQQQGSAADESLLTPGFLVGADWMIPLSPSLTAIIGVESISQLGAVNFSAHQYGVSAGMRWILPASQPIIRRDTVFRRDTVRLLVSGLKRSRTLLISESRTNDIYPAGDTTRLLTTIDQRWRTEYPELPSLIIATVGASYAQRHRSPSSLRPVRVRRVDAAGGSIDTTDVLDGAQVEFTTGVISDHPVEFWRLEITSSSGVIAYFQGRGEAPRTLLWDADECATGFIDDTLRYRFTIADKHGNTASSGDGSLVFQQKGKANTSAPTHLRQHIATSPDSLLADVAAAKKYSASIESVRVAGSTMFSTTQLQYFASQVAQSLQLPQDKVAAFTNPEGVCGNESNLMVSINYPIK